MEIWGLFWGAVLGLLIDDFGSSGLLVGGMLGLLASWSLKKAILKLIDERRQLDRDSPSLHQAVPANRPTSPVGSMASTDTSYQAVTPPLATPPGPSASPPHTPSSTSSPTPSFQKPADAAPKPATTAGVTTRAPAGAVDQALGAVKNWLLGGNTVVRVGLVILFIGLSFLARFAVATGLISIELRLAAIACAALLLLGTGFYKREQHPSFGLALQGAGVAVLYLVIFAAVRLYPLIAPAFAFGLMVVIAALGCLLALLQNSRVLALASFAGGFAVPLLLSTGQGSHVGLFGYYTILNLALLVIAYQRAWRSLNLLGFFATFGVATVWGVLQYRSDHFATTQPFLLTFVLIYVAAAIAYARATPFAASRMVDSTLVFGTALAGFGLQAGLTQSFEMGPAFSALAWGGLYLGLATWLRGKGDTYQTLMLSFAALGIGFATLAVPLALDAKWTSGVWALEGAAAFWVGCRQARWMPRAFGLLLQGLAILAYSANQPVVASALPVLSPGVLGSLLIALPLGGIAWWTRTPLAHSGTPWAKAYASLEAALSPLAYLVAFVFACLAWNLEVTRTLPVVVIGDMNHFAYPNGANHITLMLTLGCTLLAWVSTLIGRKAAWPIAVMPGQMVILLMLTTLANDWNAYPSGPAWLSGLIWLVITLVYFHQLFVRDTSPQAHGLSASGSHGTLRRLSHLNHVGGAILVTLLLARGLNHVIAQAELGSTAWASVIFLVSGTALLALLTQWAGRTGRRAVVRWPLKDDASAYYSDAAGLLAIAIALSILGVSITSSGQTQPLPYLPLFNPTDLTLALALATLALWCKTVKGRPGALLHAAQVADPRWVMAWALLGFVALNTVWLRVAHHLFNIPWEMSSLFHSFVVQTGYAILWTLLALTLMVVSHRRQQRPLWLMGAGLLALVVIKLIAIDFSNAGGGERIVAFIGVGILMLIVGYFAPLPPKGAPSLATDRSDPNGTRDTPDNSDTSW